MRPRWWRRRHSVTGAQEGQPASPDSQVRTYTVENGQVAYTTPQRGRREEERQIAGVSRSRRSRLREDDAKVIRGWLGQDLPFQDYMTIYSGLGVYRSRSFHGDDKYLYTVEGGYRFMWRARNAVFVNVSIPSLVDPFTVEQMRREALWIARELNVPLIPVAQTAWSRIENRRARYAGDVTLIEREGLEAVFRVGEDAYFLSGYDDQEDPPLYFLCRLPRAVASITEAREALKPASVRAAEANGIEVRRQGDLFAIKSELTDDQIRAGGGKLFPTPGVDEIIPIYGTAHVAARTAVMPGGVILGSGVLYHRPRVMGQNRAPDHHPLTLGPEWWWIARNTVPIESTPPQPPEYGPERPVQRLSFSTWLDQMVNTVWGDDPSMQEYMRRESARIQRAQEEQRNQARTATASFNPDGSPRIVWYEWPETRDGN